MALNSIDWICIAAFFLMTVFIGLRFAGRAGKSLGEFFLSGRKLPWYLAGFSMVATTFAADTPLAVNELVNNNGISGNWLWWNMLTGGMLTVFFFARYWRRAGIMTDVEFTEIRYGGKPAAFLRGFKAVYLGLFMNSIIIGWVNVALVSILHGFFDISYSNALYYVAGAMLLTATYSSISGMWGVAISDFIQFIIAMTGCIVLAIVVVNLPQIGGIDGLKRQLPEGTLSFIPKIGTGVSGTATGLSLGLATFLAFIGVQWWSSWYPGAEPGGGGYVAQRMMSAKDEKSSLWATLFFQVAHYCIRPWPWILVGLSTIILYPHEPDKKLSYVLAMRDHLPAGLRGLLLVTFFAAYMSCVGAQLNWGASYFINDLYKRFVRKPESFGDDRKAQKHYVMASRLFTMLAMLIGLFTTTQITSISGVWRFVAECGAGLGLVLILRWYWWRVNVWSEIVATIVPFITFGTIKAMYAVQIASLGDKPTEAAVKAFDELHPMLVFPNSFFITVAVTSICWLIATFITKPEKQEVLQAFYKRILPEGNWNPVRESLGITKEKSTIPYLVLSWLSAVMMTYSLLFLIGKIIFKEWDSAAILAVTAGSGFLLMRLGMKKAKLL